MLDNGEIQFHKAIRTFTLQALTEEIESLVLTGFRFAATGKISRQKLDQGVEERMEPLIESVLKTLRPDEFKNVQGLGALKAGSLYWDLRMKAGDPGTPFLEFLENLELML